MDILIDRKDFAYELSLLANTFLSNAFLSKEERKDLRIRKAEEKDGEARETSSLRISLFETGGAESGVCGETREGEEVRARVRERFHTPAEAKNAYKRALYRLLLPLYPETSHPWGILTGIRPVKIVHDLRAKGRSDAEIENSLRESYLISPQKTHLAMQIAGRQRAFFERIDRSIGVYIGIPFCPSRCSYCSFFSMDLSKKEALLLSERYLDALENEMRRVFRSEVFSASSVSSIYIGGGTPSALRAEQIERLLQMVRSHIPLEEGGEFTFEAGRPDSLDEEKLRRIRDSQVTRISINPQTMNDATLGKIGRRHTAQEVKDCFYLARRLGFDNINMDIILGLEDEGREELAHTLKEIEELGPESLTVHTLSVKRASKLREELDEEGKRLSEENISALMDLTAGSAERMQMQPYYLYRQKNMLQGLENTGYAKRGKESLYNIGMMEERQTILAFGSGGISKFVYPQESRIERVGNIKDVRLYIEKTEELIERKLQEAGRWSAYQKERRTVDSERATEDEYGQYQRNETNTVCRKPLDE